MQHKFYPSANNRFLVIDLCESTPCSPDAACESVGGLTLTCTCNEGFTGDGIGPNGCSAIQTPGSNTPSNVPSGNTPSGNTPSDNTPSGNAPATGGSPSSSPASSGNTPTSNVASSSNKITVGYVAVAYLVSLLW